jgi:hypothetical protein
VSRTATQAEELCTPGVTAPDVTANAAVRYADADRRPVKATAPPAVGVTVS